MNDQEERIQKEVSSSASKNLEIKFKLAGSPTNPDHVRSPSQKRWKYGVAGGARVRGAGL